jgi:hypothetical protein
MRRKNCEHHYPDACPFESGDGTMGPVFAQYKKGQMGYCHFFNPKQQCAHYPRLTNRPGRTLLDKILGR